MKPLPRGPGDADAQHAVVGAVGARHAGRDVAGVLKEVEMPPGELGAVVRLAGLPQVGQGNGRPVGGDVEMQFVGLFAGLQALTDMRHGGVSPSPKANTVFASISVLSVSICFSVPACS